MIQQLPEFILVPYLLLKDKEITLIDERLYGIIYWFAKLKLEKCIASNKTLADLINTTPPTIQNSLTKLERKGFIIRKFKDKARKHRIEILPLIVFGKVSPTSDTDNMLSLTDDSISSTDDTVVSLTDDQKKNILKEENIKNIYAHFLEKINSNSKFISKAKDKIKSRLKTFSFEELKKAIDNFSQDEWKMKHNAKRGVAWFFHSDERIEQYLNLEIIKKPKIYNCNSNK